MEFNILLAGVGGQGILTIARAISTAAVRRGFQIKQSEVHGMAQRGGAVTAHLRIADHELFSDQIPLRRANLILSIEPLETLRYLEYLAPEGVIVESTNAFINITNYPPVETIIERVAEHPNHVLIDAQRIARLAGAARATNAALLGAAAGQLPVELEDLEAALDELFAQRGPDACRANRLAIRLGNQAAMLYTAAISRGAPSPHVREWIDSLSLDQLIAADAAIGPESDIAEHSAHALSGAELHAIASLLESARREERSQLFEHEVYALVELLGAIRPPRHLFVPCGGDLPVDALQDFPGDRVALKIVSRQIVHKSEVGGVLFVEKTPERIQDGIQSLTKRARRHGNVDGALIVEFIESAGDGFGHELFIGIRATREFGPVLAAGLGGVDTELLASAMRPGRAVAKAAALDVTAEQFLDLFRQTAAYEILSGRARGHRRVASDAELLRCFRAFLRIAREFCSHRSDALPTLRELEVNPFAFVRQQMVPLDGRGALGKIDVAPPPRSIDRVRGLLEPRSIAVLGVSAAGRNFGRIILNNIQDCGYPNRQLFVIKSGPAEIDGVRCIPKIADLPEPVDLLVMAARADQLPATCAEAAESGLVRACIMIPGGVGETEGSEELMSRVRAVIARSRARPDGGTVFVGPNCLGVQSRPGRFDTFFVPPDRLDPRRSAPARPVAIISQSGAFIVSRLSNLGCLDPALTISLGNQMDATVADFLHAIADRPDIRAIGVYVEGFADLDGLSFLKAVETATSAGKIVVFYKAGRTEPGRSAAAGHTASVAGDYEVCLAAAARAGALVVDTFKEFEQILAIASVCFDKPVRGERIAAITNAGAEAVAMADAIRGVRYTVDMAELSETTTRRVEDALESHRLKDLVNARNPLDLTAMGTEEAYADVIRLMLAAEEVDAVIVSVVPLVPQLRTLPGQLSDPASIAQIVPALFREARKPLVFVVDAGGAYDALARAVRFAGVPVFRACDQAVRSLGRYIHHRATALAEKDVGGGLQDKPFDRTSHTNPALT